MPIERILTQRDSRDNLLITKTFITDIEAKIAYKEMQKDYMKTSPLDYWYANILGTEYISKFSDGTIIKLSLS
jgi:hypothetical protein